MVGVFNKIKRGLTWECVEEGRNSLGLVLVVAGKEGWEMSSSSRIALAFLARTPQKPPGSFELFIEV